MNVLKKAIERAGGQVALAGAIGTAQQSISYWLKTNKIPAEYVAKISAVTGIAKKKLRPDIF